MVSNRGTSYTLQKEFARRGASAYAPENTTGTSDLAVKMDTDGMEPDAHMTRDSELVVAHDEEIGCVSKASASSKT